MGCLWCRDERSDYELVDTGVRVGKRRFGAGVRTHPLAVDSTAVPDGQPATLGLTGTPALLRRLLSFVDADAQELVQQLIQGGDEALNGVLAAFASLAQSDSRWGAIDATLKQMCEQAVRAVQDAAKIKGPVYYQVGNATRNEDDNYVIELIYMSRNQSLAESQWRSVSASGVKTSLRALRRKIDAIGEVLGFRPAAVMTDAEVAAKTVEFGNRRPTRNFVNPLTAPITPAIAEVLDLWLSYARLVIRYEQLEAVARVRDVTLAFLRAVHVGASMTGLWSSRPSPRDMVKIQPIGWELWRFILRRAREASDAKSRTQNLLERTEALVSRRLDLIAGTGGIHAALQLVEGINDLARDINALVEQQYRPLMRGEAGVLERSERSARHSMQEEGRYRASNLGTQYDAIIGADSGLDFVEPKRRKKKGAVALGPASAPAPVLIKGGVIAEPYQPSSGIGRGRSRTMTIDNFDTEDGSDDEPAPYFEDVMAEAEAARRRMRAPGRTRTISQLNADMAAIAAAEAAMQPVELADSVPWAPQLPSFEGGTGVAGGDLYQASYQRHYVVPRRLRMTNADVQRDLEAARRRQFATDVRKERARYQPWRSGGNAQQDEDFVMGE